MRKKQHFSGGRSGGNNNNNKRRFTRKSGGGGGGVGGRFQGDESDFINPRMRKQAQTNRDKYLGLAKDAMASGDRVESEYYLQHADHYLRILNAIDAQFAPRNQGGERSEEAGEEIDENSAEPQENNLKAADNDDEPQEAGDDDAGGAQLASVLPAARTAGV